MPPNDQSLVLVPEDVSLDEREAFAYRVWCTKKDPPIAASTQAQFYQLFLQGKSCEEIRRLNPGFQLGAIVAARVHGKWDRERDRHLSDLLVKTRQRVQQTTMETVDVLCDLLAAKNKLYRDKVLKFLQTGDEELIADLKLGDIRGYKEVAEALMKITGQDQQKKVSGTVNLNVSAAPTPTANPTVNPSEVLAALRDYKRLQEEEKS